MVFVLEEQRPVRCLLASVSESSSQNLKLPKLQLPSFRIGHPGTSPRWPLDTKAAAGRPSPRQLKQGPHELGQEVQRVAALIGGILVAGVSGVVQNFANSRPGVARSRLPFHQSFTFPWQKRGHITQRSESYTRILISLLSFSSHSTIIKAFLLSINCPPFTHCIFLRFKQFSRV